MNKNKLLKTLKNLGLSENEALVYFTALSLGSTSIKKIAEHSGVKRTSIYSIIEDLKQHGLIHVDVSGFKHKYVAENPQTLAEMIDRKRAELAESMSLFQTVYDNTAKQSSITYIEGMTAVRKAYLQLPEGLKRNDPYLIITNQAAWHALDTEFADAFIEKRSKLGLDIRMLAQDSEKAKEFKRYQQNFGMEVRLLPEKTNLQTNLVITPKQVLIQQLTFPIVALRIENESIINMHQQIFEILWDATSQ
jgi:predicted transcriptional regulator